MYNSDFTQQIRDIAKPKDVAALLGIPMKPMGKNTSILCPIHDDKHYGSCYLTHKGFKCFSCQAEGSVFDMVMAVNQCDFYAAKVFLAEHFGITKTKSSVYKKATQILDDDSLRLIGIIPPKKSIGICHINNVISDAEYNYEDRKANQYAEWFPSRYCGDSSASESGYYVLKTTIDSNPLRTLLDTNEALYRQMIFNKAKEALQNYKNIELIAMNHWSQYDDELSALIARCCAQIIQTLGLNSLLVVLKEKQQKCYELIKEYGTYSNTSSQKASQKIYSA
ncbi:MAG: hypothetical protein IJY88_01485 [Clostridia bacterium]|nr:hypothetical protein [Clostridia bacterium]